MLILPRSSQGVKMHVTAGLLTYFLFGRLPIKNLNSKTVAKICPHVWTKFTAAGLSGIYTRFPFNPPREYGYGTLRYKDGKYLRIDKANHIN